MFLSDGKRVQKSIQVEQATPRVKSTTKTVIALGRLSLDLHLGNRMMMGEQSLCDDVVVSLQVSAEGGSPGRRGGT